MIKDIIAKILFLPLFLLLFVACDDSVTYSDMKEKERSAVNHFVKDKGINIISFSEFVANDSTTDVLKNEFVEVDDVYMQIVNNPVDAADAFTIADGDSRNMLVRYSEYNILDGDTISANNFMGEADEMRVSNNGGTFSATFTSGVMKSIYGNSVPTGWLVPLRFLKFTRSQSNLAKVNIIVPHSKGTTTAAMYVYPCLYQITFQPENSYVVEDDDSVTYSDMKEKERSAVNHFVKDKGINIISFSEFVANDYTTDVQKNEFVEVDDVYMQIVNNPVDAADAFTIADGDSRNMLVRYSEYNILDGDTISANNFMGEADEMRVSNNGGTFSATFTSGVMKSIYGNSVPTGWLVPLRFLKFTRSQSNLAKVNIIVPHSKGTTTAAMYVYPCLYQITFQPENSYVVEDEE